MPEIQAEGEDRASPTEPERNLVDAARDAFAGAIQVAEASLALLRAELKLASRSAVTIIWLGFGLIFLGAAAWLSLNAAIAVGVFQLSDNLFLGIASVAVINTGGAIWVIAGMRRSWRDLTLPQTRALIVSGSRSPPQPEHK